MQYHHLQLPYRQGRQLRGNVGWQLLRRSFAAHEPSTPRQRLLDLDGHCNFAVWRKAAPAPFIGRATAREKPLGRAVDWTTQGSRL